MTTTAATRRTVASMEARLAKARELIGQMRDDSRAKYETASSDDARTFEDGCACGLDQALAFLDWAFDPDKDWMYR